MGDEAVTSFFSISVGIENDLSRIKREKETDFNQL